MRAGIAYRRLSVAEDDRLRRPHRGRAREDVQRRRDIRRGGDREGRRRLEAVPVRAAAGAGRPARAARHPLPRGRGRSGSIRCRSCRGMPWAACAPTSEARVGAAPAFIRWPGGNVAQDYRWIWGVGPRDRRPTWVNLSWKNEPEPGDFGTDEFIALLPRASVRSPRSRSTSKDAARRPKRRRPGSSTATGRRPRSYGAMRAANGHPEPYGVKYWELGNEIWGDWVRGHSDAETYARNYLRYDEAMRAVDPDDPVHRRRRQRHGAGTAPCSAPPATHRLPGDSSLLRARGDGGRRRAT